MPDITITHLRPGALSRTASLLDALEANAVFLVADPQAYHACGATHTLQPIWQNRRLVTFSDFAPNPKLADAEKGLDLFRQAPCDAVIAVGGGTAIDIAKMIAVFSAHEAAPRAIATGTAPIQRSGPPLIAVPTTAGTGAEATHFAVVYIDGNKYSLAHPFLLPHATLVDPDLTASLPPPLTAHTGLDALCQAIESLWSVHADATSLNWARQALALGLKHLEAAYRDPTAAARLGMCQAAHLAGRAINRSKTTAPHALSYALTSDYGVPHGLAVALTLAPILAYNAAVSPADANDPRGPAWTRARMRDICAIMEVTSPAAACQRWENLLHALACPTRLTAVGVNTPARIDALAAAVNTERLANNPRKLDTEAIGRLLAEIT